MNDSLPSGHKEGNADFQHLLATRNLCVEYNNALGSRRSEISGIWSASLFVRSIAALDSVILLIRFDLNDDAAIIIRTLFEIELQLGAIKEQPELAVQLVQRTEAYRCGRLKALIEGKREMPEGITREAMAEQLEQIRAAGIPSDVKKGELAKKAGLQYEYRTVYSLLSDIAHLSPMGLAHYLERMPQPERSD